MPKRKYVQVGKTAFVKRRRASVSTAKKALNMAKQVKKMVNKTIENKQVNYVDTNRSITTASYNTGGFLSTSVGAEDGTTLGSAARIGNSITLMSQKFNFNFIASSTDTFNQMRLLLVESMDGNQALSIGDILQYGSYALYGGLVFASPYTTKTATNRRYKIHMDKSFTISGLPSKGGVSPVKIIKHTIKWKNGKVLEYDGTGAVSPNNHRISLIVISDSASATHPSMSYSARATYKDA